MTLIQTPGPWYVSRKLNKNEAGKYIDGGYDREGGVFYVHDEHPDTIVYPWNEGDACLIAAAPDMLEVLKETEQVLERLRYELVSYRVCVDLEALTEHTKKVISKAEGR